MLDFKTSSRRNLLILLAVFALAIGMVAYILTSRSAIPNPYEHAVETFPFVEQPPEVSLISASATQDSLEFAVRVSGFPVGVKYAELDYWICKPYVRTRGLAKLTNLGSMRGGWTDISRLGKGDYGVNGPWLSALITEGEPIELHYAYTLEPLVPDFKLLPLHIDLTFGPCYPRNTNPIEGAIKPVEWDWSDQPFPDIPMIANYVIETEISVQ